MKRFKKIAALCLSMFLLTGMLPSHAIHAEEATSTYGIGGGNNEEGTDGQWTPVNVEGKLGTFVKGASADSDTLFVKSVAKARTSSYYYNTSGFSVHTDYSASMNPEDSRRLIYVPFYNYEDSSIPKPPTKTLSTGEKVYFYGTSEDPSKLNAWGHSEIYHDRTSDPGNVIMVARVNKNKLLQGMLEDGAKFSDFIRTGSNDIKLFSSAISSVYQYTQWHPSTYVSYEQFKNNAGRDLWDVVGKNYDKYFNIPFYFNGDTKNTISFFDITTGKRIHFEDIGNINVAEPGRSTLHTAYGPQTIPKYFTDSKGKKYELYVSQYLPGKYLTETSGSSILEAKYINALNVDKTKPEELYKSSRVMTQQTRTSPQWNSEQVNNTMGAFKEKFPNTNSRSSFEGQEGVIWDNINENHFGSTIVAHYKPVGDGDIVCYDNSTGKAIKEDFKNIKNSYTFQDKIQDDKGNLYEFVQSSKRENTNLKDDKVKTLQDVLDGKGVTLPTDKDVSKNVNITLIPDEIGRGEYKPVNGIPVLYYDEDTGTLLDRESLVSSSTNTYSVRGSLQYLKETYVLSQSSYRIDTDAETDIATTRKPVMTSKDLGVSKSDSVTVSAAHATKNIVIRVSMKKPDLDVDGGKGTYVIPSQHLTKEFDFSFGEKLQSIVAEVVNPPSTTHTYSCSGCRCDGHGHNSTCAPDCSSSHKCGGCYCPGYHVCTISYKYEFGVHQFDWSDNLKSILTAGNVFADKGGITKISGMEATGSSWEVNASPSLHFISHREAVDNVMPSFAKYMHDKNAQSISFLKAHNLGDTVTESLVGKDYSDKGGSKSANVSATVGSKLNPHGRKFKLTTSHSSCRVQPVSVEGVLPPSSFTSKTFSGTVKAEPAIKATSLSTAPRVNKIDVSGNGTKVTLLSSPNAIAFYPTFKMYAGGYDAWVLGSEQRKYVPVDAYEIEVINSDSPIKVESTWSRDKADQGRLVMKGGYNYGVSTGQPVKIKVTSYIHVPKEGYIENAATDRSTRLKAHDNLVSSLMSNSNFKIYSNLPEAYQNSYPDSWKVSNPYKKSGDNVSKSRMQNPVGLSSSKSSATQVNLKLEDMASRFGGQTQSKKRLDDQLETKDWYKEVFDGIEVVKQETIISYTFDQTVQTNFLRNGGQNYNDLAKSIATIPSGKFGVTAGVQLHDYNLNGVGVTLNVVTKPSLFDVRGMMYDDRN